MIIPTPPISYPAPQAIRAASKEASNYLNRVEKLVGQCESLSPRTALLGDGAAEELSKGGTLYIGGDPGLIAEGEGRAGGLMMTQSLKAPSTAPAHSVLLYGWKSPQELAGDLAWLRALKDAGVTVIGIGTHAPDGANTYPFRGVLALHDTDGSVRRGQERFCPVGAMGNAINLWTLTGEIIGGLSRRHLTPTVWQSIWVDGSKERNAPRIGHPFDPLLTIAPIPPGQLAREYTQYLRQALHSLHQSIPQFVDAAEDLQAARRNGKTARLTIVAHMVALEIGGPEDPGYLKMLPDPVTAGSMEAGDSLLGLGYVGIPEDTAKIASDVGVGQTWFVAPGVGTPPTNPNTRWIDARWKLGDVAVSLPGYDVGALPPSGVLQLTAYWTVNAAMIRLDDSGAK